MIIGGTTSPLDREGESDLGIALSDELKREDIFLSMVNISTKEILWTFRDGSSSNDGLYTMLMDDRVGTYTPVVEHLEKYTAVTTLVNLTYS